MTSGPADGDSLVGRVLDSKYRIDRLLGRGGFGSVYLATHLHLDHPCAIKVLHRSVLADSMAVARFQQEARATVRIRHPNAIAVMDFGMTPDSIVYFVMEYFPGASLREVVRRDGPMPLGRAARILECVAGALAAAHAQGILHRDVKPDNIMLARAPDGGDEVKVVDFGIAKLLDSPHGSQPLTLAGTILGTPYYLSPEQVNGLELDPRSDLYALGVVTYEMLTGAVPFNAPTPIAVAMKHVSEQPPPLQGRVPGLTPHVEAVLLRALAKHREDRYPSTLAFARDFSAAVNASSGAHFFPAPAQPQVPGGYTAPIHTHGASLPTPRPPYTPVGAETTAIPPADTPHTPVRPETPPGPGRDPHTVAISWNQDATTSLEPRVSVPTPVPTPTRSAPPPAAELRSAPGSPLSPLAHVRDVPAAARSLEAPAPRMERGTRVAVVAISLSLVAVLAAGILAAAIFWTHFESPAATPEARTEPRPGPVPARPASAVPLFDLTAVVYKDKVNKRVVWDFGKPVTLAPGELVVQFDLDPRVAGYVYVLETSGDEITARLTARPNPEHNIATNEIVQGREFLFPGSGKAISLSKAKTFTVLFSPVPLASPTFLARDSGKVLDAAETDEWRRFLEAARRAEAKADGARKTTTVAGPTGKDPVEASVFDISFDVR